jgi:hypothetical protein
VISRNNKPCIMDYRWTYLIPSVLDVAYIGMRYGISWLLDQTSQYAERRYSKSQNVFNVKVGSE